MAYDTISQANKEAYKDFFMISNSVLSKIPSNNHFLDYYMKDNFHGEHSFFVIGYRLFLYFIKSFTYFAMYLFKFIEYAMASFRPCLRSDSDELILIDVPFLSENICKTGNFHDPFFPGMEDILIKNGKNYAYLPYFYSSTYNRKPLELLRVFKVLKKEKVKVITEYQILSARDLLKVVFFIATYPLHVFRFSRTLSNGEGAVKALKYELLNTIDQVTFYNYVRYLVGRKIADMPYRKIKVFSWYENQSLHKNLYKGLRSSISKKVTIYGAQLFLGPKRLLSLIPDENESVFGILPDKVIVNGSYYIPQRTSLAYEVGPSLRYSGIFDVDIKKESRKEILILLPYLVEEARNILRVLLASKFVSRNIFVKPHPATPLKSIRHLIPPNAVIVEKTVYQLFEIAKILISSASGSMIEAATLGIPVISINKKGCFEWSNPFPEYGKGIVWETAVSAEDLDCKIEQFERKLQESPEEINAVAARYKEMLFSRPTEESIVKTFDL